jgi:glutamate/tyrosine decarboxylase-like PLP-dependent enzyme
MSLDFKPDHFKSLVNQCAEILESWYAQGLRNTKIYNNYSPESINALFDGPLPQASTSPEELLKIIEKDVFKTSNFNPSPNYYGYITGGGNQAAILAELLRNGLNQNNLKWHSAPANSEIEKIVIKWICQFIGYPETAGGVLVSGGSVGNFLHLAVMRKAKCPVDVAKDGMYNAPKMIIYVSKEGHSSIEKAVDMLGFGKSNIRKIATNADFQIDTTALVSAIESDLAVGYLPVCVIGMAGSTNTGSVDDLDKLADIAAQYNLWYMVDGAYGLPAAHLASTKSLFKGFERADAVLINPHKWFFVPFEVACVIVKDKKYLKDTFHLIPDYLKGGAENTDREDLMDYNLQLTKDFKALKVWMTFKTYGADRIAAAIQNDCDLAWYFRDQIDQSVNFEMLAPVPLSIACFRYIGKEGLLKNKESELEFVNQQLLAKIESDGRIFFAGTKINGKTALRVNLTNHRRTKEDIDFLISVLGELGAQCEEVN